MLRKLRRSSKEPTQALPSRQDSAIAQPPEEENPPLPPPPSPRRLNFFDLPAELRNTVYEHLISETTLTLPASILPTPSKKSKLHLKRRKSLPTAPINGILLASKQCRHEYSSLLLSTANVAVEVRDFDFENLARVCSALGDDEIRALSSNRNLTIQLVTQNCTPKNLSLLHRWLQYRTSSSLAGAKLPWKYAIPLDRLLPPTRIGQVRLLTELEYYTDKLYAFSVEVEREQQGELQAIMKAFENTAYLSDEDIRALRAAMRDSPRLLMGLAGGGVH